MLLAQRVEGDRPAVGPLAPELAQAIEFHKQPLEGRDLGLQIVVAPLLQQPVGLIHGGSTFDVAGHRLLQRQQVAGQITGVADGLAEPGGGGD